jgi:hypothetical protein
VPLYFEFFGLYFSRRALFLALGYIYPSINFFKLGLDLVWFARLILKAKKEETIIGAFFNSEVEVLLKLCSNSLRVKYMALEEISYILQY